MQVLTLTSDIGISDPYVAQLRGTLLRELPETKLVELNLQLPPFNLVRSAFIFRESYRAYPKGCLHLVTLYDRPDAKVGMVFFQHEGYYFLGPDNGFFSLVFPNLDLPYFGKPFGEDHIYASYAVVARQILAQEKLSDIGSVVALRRGFLVQPIEQMSEIRATVVHTDRFGNVFTNLRRDTFERIGRDRPFSLYFKRHDPIRTISQFYQEVAVGNPLAKFNNEVLEIAVNSGDAATLLGLRVDDVVLMVFENT